MTDLIPTPYSLENAEWFIDYANTHQSEVHLAIEVDESAVGAVGFHPKPANDIQRHSGSIGYWIGEDYWGRGIVTEAVTAMTHHIFENTPFVRLDATVFCWNPASARVLEKAGFNQEAVLKAYYVKNGDLSDGWLYAKVKPAFE